MAGALLLCTQFAGAAYPDKPIRLIVPLAAGGGNDIISRYMAQKLFDVNGHRVVVENRAGATGIIGTDAVAKAAPDGYTMLMGGTAQIILNPLLNREVKLLLARDLVPVAQIVEFPQLELVRSSLPVSNVKELIQYAKANPGKINYASSGTGGGSHIAMENLQMMAGIRMVHVPYKGAGPALADLVAGNVDLLQNNPVASMVFVKTGKIRAIATSSRKRLAIAPDVPTLEESGMPGFSINNWVGLFFPGRTPGEIVDRIDADLAGIMRQKDVVTWFDVQGIEPVASSSKLFTEKIQSDTIRWQELIKKVGNIVVN